MVCSNSLMAFEWESLPPAMVLLALRNVSTVLASPNIWPWQTARFSPARVLAQIDASTEQALAELVHGKATLRIALASLRDACATWSEDCPPPAAVIRAAQILLVTLTGAA